MNEKQLLTKELKKRVIKKFKRRPIITTYKNHIWASDLLDVSNMSKYNKNYTFLLIIVDIFSRYAFVKPLKNKGGEEVLKGFKSIKEYPSSLWVDEGKEFYNKEVKEYCKENNIDMYHTYSGLKSVFAERFNRTLRDLIFEYLNNNDTKQYIDELDDIVDKYNNTYHSSIKETPYNIYIKGELPKNKIYLKDEEPEFDIGDYVRKVNVKKMFEKSYTARWSEELYKVVNIDDFQLPIMYEIEDMKGLKVKGKFYKNQLSKSEFREKVDSSKVKDMVKESTVRKKILKEGLGDVIRESKRERVPNKKYLVV